jgi:hypothetical protein
MVVAALGCNGSGPKGGDDTGAAPQPLGDGFADLVFAQRSIEDEQVAFSTIYWGSESGPAPEDPAELPTLGAIRVLASDIDGDGLADLVFPNLGLDDDTLATESYVYWGQPEGYDTSHRTALPNEGALSAAVGDLDNNGTADLVLGTSFVDIDAPEDSWVYWGVDGDFDTDHRQALPTVGPSETVVHDLDQDGYPDLLFANNLIGDYTQDIPNEAVDASIYWSSGGAFTQDSRTDLPSLGASTIQATDIDGDGFVDLFFGNVYDGESFDVASVIYWGSAGGYSEDDAAELPCPGAASVVIEDLDADGHTDIAIASNTNGISFQVDSMIYWGSETGFSEENVTALPSRGARALDAADLDDDGWTDLVVVNHTNGTGFSLDSRIYWGSEERYSEEDITELPTIGAVDVVVHDLNADDYLDLVFAQHHNGTTSEIDSRIYWGSEDGYSEANLTELPTHGATDVLVLAADGSIVD